MVRGPAVLDETHADDAPDHLSGGPGGNQPPRCAPESGRQPEWTVRARWSSASRSSWCWRSWPCPCICSAAARRDAWCSRPSPLLPRRGGSLRSRLAWVPDAAVALALVALVVAAAGPRVGERFSRVHREGIAIMMVVDVSGSMQALDLSTEDRERTRLEAVQDVFEAFVLGGGDLPGRRDDAIGLVRFAGYADTAAPLTLDHQNLAAAARNLAIVRDRAEDGTAIGDALGLDGRAAQGLDREFPHRAAAHRRRAQRRCGDAGDGGGTGPLHGHQGVHDRRRHDGTRARAGGGPAHRPHGAARRFGGSGRGRARGHRRAYRAAGFSARATPKLSPPCTPRSTVSSARASPRNGSASTRNCSPCRWRWGSSWPPWAGCCASPSSRGCPEMDAIVFAEPLRVHLVWLAVAAAVACAWFEFRGADRLQYLISTQMQERLARRRRPLNRAVQVALVLATPAGGGSPD